MDKLFNNKSDILLSTIAPSPLNTRYWADLSEDPSGGTIKFFNGTSWKNVNYQDIENVKELQKNKIGREEVPTILTDTNTITANEDKVTISLGKYDSISKKNSLTDINIPVATDTKAGILNATKSYKLNNLPTRAVEFLDTTEFVEIKDDTQEAIFNFKGINIGDGATELLNYSKSIPCASTTNFGFMSKQDKNSLEALIAKANAGIDVNEIPDAETLYSYGVAWEVDSLNPTLIRVGNMDLHRALPVQNAMRGCTLADDGTVNHYFKSDWSANEDGTAIIKDGSDGMVMIEVPAFYIKAEVKEGFNYLKVSQYPLDGYSRIEKQYISAYEAVVDRTISGTPKLSSVVNLTEAFRGGNNDATRDGTDKTQLGFPSTSITRAIFRNYARNRAEGLNWNMYDFLAANTIWLLFTIEYATFNSQLAVNNELTSEGFKQGGLGIGVTDLSSSDWSAFNGYSPLIPCGTTDTLGNNSGEVEYQLPDSYKADTVVKVKPNRYRGIENPFGHIWKNVDGIIFNVTSDGGNIMLSESPSDYNDDLSGTYIQAGLLPASGGWISDTVLGTLLPIKVGGSSTTGRCDQVYISSNAGKYTFLHGGCADDGSDAGLGCVDASLTVGSAYANLGSRLVYRI